MTQLSREKILSKLQGEAAKVTLSGSIDSPQLFSDYPAPGELRETFARAFTALKGEIYFPESKRDTARLLLSILTQLEGPIAVQHHRLLSYIIALDPGLQERLNQQLPREISAPELAQAAAGITVAECLSARTGSILINSSIAGGRRLSVLPPVHIVIAQEDQLAPSLAPWLTIIKQDPTWSAATIISGPSRTADIEKILVLGAHGPKRLILLLLRPE